AYWKLGRFLRLRDHKGPLSLYIGDEESADFDLALQITARYGDAPAEEEATLLVLHQEEVLRTHQAVPLPKGDELAWLIT
ncbi:MAG: hypothetical protein KDA24_25040, partial [Deltaproteobacteria bacterium]|nr:hypothetical protein [Deltaproteobacteria bacterium]